jgi:hypothetical protein
MKTQGVCIGSFATPELEFPWGNTMRLVGIVMKMRQQSHQAIRGAKQRMY